MQATTGGMPSNSHRAAASYGLLAPVFLALLAGCTGTAEPVSEADGDSPCVALDAADTACLDEAARAAQVGGPARPHLHDYWRGQTRLVLSDVEQPESHRLCVDIGPLAVLRPADGDAIIQGTSAVEATVSWDPQGPLDLTGDAELWVKSAADDQPRRVGPAASGDRFVLATDNDRNDLPHQRLSAWEFHVLLRPNNPTGCFTYTGTARLHLELVRGHGIPLFPGHTDRWNGTTSQPLFDDATAAFFYRGGARGACLGGPFGGDCLWTPHTPRDKVVVPYDAAQVVVTVAAAGQASQVPLRVKLAYHGADVRELTMPAADSDDGTTRVYKIPVDDKGDGPYAKQSQWEFWTLPDNEAALFTGEFTVSAVAHKVPT